MQKYKLGKPFDNKESVVQRLLIRMLLEAIADPRLADVKSIALTGAPCAGKSTAEAAIQNFLPAAGYRTLFVPEGARLLLGSGADIGAIIENDKLAEFQEIMVLSQIFMEYIYRRLAVIHPEDKQVLILDRGRNDSKAFVPDDAFAAMVKDMGATQEDMRDAYDAVMLLVTAAEGAEEFYVTDDVRHESPERARELHKETLKAWTGTEKMRIIPNVVDGVQITFQEKMGLLITAIAETLGIPTPIERERKFLFNTAVLDVLDDLELAPVANDIIQDYLDPTDHAAGIEHRVRATMAPGHGVFDYSTTYAEAYKEDIETNDPDEALARAEDEHVIRTADAYRALLETKQPGYAQIVKRRYSFPFGNLYFQLDHFSEPLELVVCEIELTDGTEIVTFPEIMEPYLIKEVTHDPLFRNAAIAAGDCPGYEAE